MRIPSLEKLSMDSLAWVRNCLESGEALSQSVLSGIKLDSGELFLAVTAAEYHAALSSHHPFNEAVLDQKVVDTVAPAGLLLDRLLELERLTGSLAVITEDNLRSPGDPILTKNPADKIYQFKNGFYSVKKLADIHTPTELASHLNQSSGYPLNAFVVLTADIPDKKKLDQADINRITSSVHGVINFVYDGETYMMWLSK